MTAPLTPRERVEAEIAKVCWTTKYQADDRVNEPKDIFVPASFAFQLAAELGELQKKCDQLTGMKFSDRMHAALVSRAEAAEREVQQSRHAFHILTTGTAMLELGNKEGGALEVVMNVVDGIHVLLEQKETIERQLSRYREKYGELE